MEFRIDRAVIEYVVDFSREFYPREFMALLRAKRGENFFRIHEVVFAPGLKSGTRSATFDPSLIPHYFDVIGTVHSHPTPNPEPSKKDLRMFSTYPVNMIVFHPFRDDCWIAYDRMGAPLHIVIS